MAVRIEYLLLTAIAFLLLSILGLNPSSYEAKSSKANKEIEFQNFSLSDIKTDNSGQKISASKTIKYRSYLELEDINMTGENRYTLLSKKAIYKDDIVYMHKGVKILREDNLSFSTENLTFNVKNKELQTKKPFILKFNKSRIEGDNLELFLDNKKILADNIDASIWFVSKDDKDTIQE